jgi:hypothetical protein
MMICIKNSDTKIWHGVTASNTNRVQSPSAETSIARFLQPEPRAAINKVRVRPTKTEFKSLVSLLSAIRAPSNSLGVTVPSGS